MELYRSYEERKNDHRTVPWSPGSTLIIRNNGVINMASGKEFIAPVGTIVNIESGEIN
jgi:hypothetical protein